MSLTDIEIRNAKPREKEYKITDEKGLSLLIKPNGSKLWRYRYRFAGKERMQALVAYPEISLKDARNKRDKGRRLLDEGKDPALRSRYKKPLISASMKTTLRRLAVNGTK